MRTPDKAKGVVFKLRARYCEGVSDHLPMMSEAPDLGSLNELCTPKSGLMTRPLAECHLPPGNLH